MTVEQKADKYALANKRSQGSSSFGELSNYHDLRKGFIDGYHECQKEHEWHDLQKDPNDLPKNSPYFSGQSVRVIGAIPLSEDKYISLECRYFYSEKKWKTQEDCSVVKVIAWCEIPTFDKEKEK